MRTRHAVALSAMGAVLLVGWIAMAGPVTTSDDPYAYEEAARLLAAGKNPYIPSDPDLLKVAYSPVFLVYLLPFVVAFGYVGVFVALTGAAACLPLMVWGIARRLGPLRAAQYATLLSLALPSVVFFPSRWAIEDIFVPLAVLATLLLFLKDRPLLALVVGAVLSIKFISWIPIAALMLVSTRAVEPALRGSLLLKQVVAFGVPTALINSVAYALWGEPFLHNVYVKTIAGRASAFRPSANAFQTIQVSGQGLPTWVYLTLAFLVLGSVLFVYARPIRDKLSAVTWTLAVTMLAITTLNADFGVWIIPIAVLFYAGSGSARARAGVWLVVILDAMFRAFDYVWYNVVEGVRIPVTVVLGLAITAVLVLVAWQAVCQQGRRGHVPVGRVRDEAGEGSGDWPGPL